MAHADSADLFTEAQSLKPALRKEVINKLGKTGLDLAEQYGHKILGSGSGFKAMQVVTLGLTNCYT